MDTKSKLRILTKKWQVKSNKDWLEVQGLSSVVIFKWDTDSVHKEVEGTGGLIPWQGNVVPLAIQGVVCILG